MPETMRGALLVSPVRPSSGKTRPLRAPRAACAPMPEPATSSMIEFQSPQDSHLPCQRWLTAPQFWQMKFERALAMSVCLSQAARAASRPVAAAPS